MREARPDAFALLSSPSLHVSGRLPWSLLALTRACVSRVAFVAFRMKCHWDGKAIIVVVGGAEGMYCCAHECVPLVSPLPNSMSSRLSAAPHFVLRSRYQCHAMWRRV